MIDSPLALATVIAAATALAFWLDYRFAALGKVGASMLAIVFGAVLSNAGLVPVGSVVYDIVLGPVTSVSIAWLLLSVDLRDLAKAGPRMMGAFAVAVTGTVLGALVAAAVYGPQFGDDTWRIAGALTGTYSGGSVNFVSVGRRGGPHRRALRRAERGRRGHDRRVAGRHAHAPGVARALLRAGPGRAPRPGDNAGTGTRTSGRRACVRIFDGRHGKRCRATPPRSAAGNTPTSRVKDFRP